MGVFLIKDFTPSLVIMIQTKPGPPAPRQLSFFGLSRPSGAFELFPLWMRCFTMHGSVYFQPRPFTTQVKLPSTSPPPSALRFPKLDIQFPPSESVSVPILGRQQPLQRVKKLSFPSAISPVSLVSFLLSFFPPLIFCFTSV